MSEYDEKVLENIRHIAGLWLSENRIEDGSAMVAIVSELGL